MLSNNKRILPSYLIIGTQKGGTTFLYNNLIRHPEVLPAWTREVHYFDQEFRKGPSWYRAFFPHEGVAESGRSFITGESSPSYMYHAQAPSRMAKLLPNAKLIICLRDPASRAMSHYQMAYFGGAERFAFKEAIAREDAVIERHLAGDETLEFDGRYSYRSRGLYLAQIQRLERYFPKENILVLDSAKMYKQSGPVLREVERFLGIEGWEPPEFRPENEAKLKIAPDEEAMQQLRDFFRPYNQALFDHLGWDQVWK